MRKLTEQKLANAKNKLEQTRKKIKEFTNSQETCYVATLIMVEQYLLGAIETYEDLLNSKELSELEHKSKAFDELIEHKLTMYRLPNGASIIGFDYTPDVEKMENEMARELVDNLMKALGGKNE